ncbi:hypothetical protein ACFLXG_00200 [Chloroflexota bacterium]
MAPRYEIGQKVRIRPVSSQPLSPRDSGLEQYAGQHGEVADYYWITLDMGSTVVYTYTIRVGESREEVVLHEDELEADRG